MGSVTYWGAQTSFEVFPVALIVASETPGSDWLLTPPVLSCYCPAFPVTVKTLDPLSVLLPLKMALPELLTALRAPPGLFPPPSPKRFLPSDQCPKSSDQPSVQPKALGSRCPSQGSLSPSRCPLDHFLAFTVL